MGFGTHTLAGSINIELRTTNMRCTQSSALGSGSFGLAREPHVRIADVGIQSSSR